MQDLAAIGLKTSNTVKEMLQRQLYQKLPKVAKQAAALAVQRVKQWAAFVTWNSHRATNKAYGHRRDYKGVWYDWLKTCKLCINCQGLTASLTTVFSTTAYKRICFDTGQKPSI